MKSTTKQNAAAETKYADVSDFSSLLDKEFKPKTTEARDAVEAAVRTLAEQALVNAVTMAASTHLGREARNPDGLAHTLARFFAVPVQLQEFVMHWIRIDDEDQSHLGKARASSIMGVGAIAGEVVADRQNKFRLVLGPLSLEQYLRFTPQGKDLPLLVEWVRGFIGYEFVWEVELRVRNDNTPPARLEDTEKLGWSTWLGGSEGAALGAAATRPCAAAAVRALDYAVGMVFEPEQYVGSRYRAAVP
ncbi:type VI secretion system baseplate subunit TssG [Xenophilus aerolatus]